MPEVSVASFNVHGGVDGWGRPFDVVDACCRLDADVLVLQETWTPVSGEGVAERIASALGYRVTSVSMAPARRYPVPAVVGSHWGPWRRRRTGVGLRVDLGGPRWAANRSSGERGAVGLALLERRSVVDAEVLNLGRMGSDRARRVAVRTMVGDGGASPAVTVVATHLPHIRQGSLLHLRRLRAILPGPDVPAVLMGDMNMWGPPLSMLLPGWSRAVLGRSWPSWQPMFQIDHILVTAPVRVIAAEVVAVRGSDHLPVRASLSVA